MASTDERRYTAWLDLTAELIRRPDRSFPRTLLSRALEATFDTAVAWNWMTSDGNWGMESVNAPVDLLEAVHSTYWQGEGLMRHHPLVRWFQATLDPAPMSMDRVPGMLAPQGDRVRERLRPLGLDQQLSIPYRLGDREHLAFVLGRTGEPFHDDHLALAGRIQALICLTARQYAVLERTHAGCDAAAAVGLTGRETAVLALLAQGLTAVAIAHRLGVSHRTVHKHLEHIYAKLRVGDRLSAVVLAHQMGLVRAADGGGLAGQLDTSVASRLGTRAGATPTGPTVLSLTSNRNTGRSTVKKVGR